MFPLRKQVYYNFRPLSYMYYIHLHANLSMYAKVAKPTAVINIRGATSGKCL